jgi:hypothetical protein
VTLLRMLATVVMAADAIANCVAGLARSLPRICALHIGKALHGGRVSRSSPPWLPQYG